MWISKVKSYLVSLARRKNWLFVKIETSEGLTGWGEGYTQLDREQAPFLYVEQLSRYLVGRSPFNIKHFTQVAYDDFMWRRGTMDFYCALSAIEQALWDVVGKAVGQPVYNLLGGACRARIQVYANGWFWGAVTPADYARAAERCLEQGFTALKIYPLSGPTRSFVSREHIHRAVEVVHAIRDATGPDVALLVDVRRRLAPMRAIELARRLEEYDLFWLEEPCPPENVDALVEIRHSTSIPLAAGEALFTKAGFRELFEKRAVDIVMPDVASVGGILETKEVAAMAEPYHMAVAPHNYNSTTLGLAATVQVAAAIPNFLIAEYFVPFAEEGRKLANQLEVKNGFIDLPQTPGLGVTLDEDALSNYPYKQYDKRFIPTYENEML